MNSVKNIFTSPLAPLPQVGEGKISHSEESNRTIDNRASDKKIEKLILLIMLLMSIDGTKLINKFFRQDFFTNYFF